MKESKYFKKLKNTKNKILVTKIVIYSLIVLGSILTISFIPRKVIDTSNTYEKALSEAVYEEKNDIALYDYKVYGTKKRFEEGIKVEIPKYKEKFKSENRLLLVKLPGDEDKVEKFDDYILETSKEVPKLNIEFYVIKNVTYKDSVLPTETFITAYKGFGNKLNNIYFITTIVVFPLLSVGFLIPTIFNSYELYKRKNKKYLKGERYEI